MAAYNCNCDGRPRLLLPESRSEGDEEIVFLHCNDAQQASMMTCDGLLCFTERDRVIVLNPSTGQLQRFRFGPNPVASKSKKSKLSCVMGFGRDKVSGSYKVVRMFFNSSFHCEILDVNIGEWRKLSPPPYEVDVGTESVCVNGSIYWLRLGPYFNILALNLHTLEFHDVSLPDTCFTFESHLVNLEDRLVLAKSKTWGGWELIIWIMDAEEEIWSSMYSISLADLTGNPWETTWFRLVTVSKLGDVVFSDNHKRLYKYYQETAEIRCLSSDICVISPYLENLVPIRSESGRRDLYPYIRTSRCRFLDSCGISTWNPSRIFDIAFIILVGCGCSLMYKIMG
ncbi:unnamed protein product [Arabis nemorensis]|uniref:F-box associated beta-propeller type 3 domain-containing protein n=1 Tax=Arabis nemorensis TaxID=586526 RepID=A0A565BNL7_9BRAS|nr:unnamed protein product [Arabis nemorensis]